MSKNNQKTIVMSIVVVILFVVCVVAISYAYYTSFVEKDNGNNTVKNETATINAIFTDGAELNYQNMIPGDSFTKTFTLENAGKSDISYKIVISNVTNTFKSPSDIEIVVSEDGKTINTMTFPSTTSTISGNDTLIISSGSTKSYTVTITYKNTAVDQSADMNSIVSGKIFIEEV